MEWDTYHCNEAQITFLLEVGFDCSQAASGGLCDGLEEERLADTELDPQVIGAQLHADQQSNEGWGEVDYARGLCTNIRSPAGSECRPPRFVE